MPPREVIPREGVESFLISPQRNPILIVIPREGVESVYEGKKSVFVPSAQ
jgi:hypothetical protein